jgi:hypothetical protein
LFELLGVDARLIERPSAAAVSKDGGRHGPDVFGGHRAITARGGWRWR